METKKLGQNREAFYFDRTDVSRALLQRFITRKGGTVPASFFGFQNYVGPIWIVFDNGIFYFSNK